MGQPLAVRPRQLEAEDGDRGIMAPIVYSFDRGERAQLQRPSVAFLSEPDESEETGGADSEQDQELAGSNSSATPNIERYLNLNPATGELRLIRRWPRARWPQPGWPLTLVVRATQLDNRDRYALTTLTISSAPSSEAGTKVQATSQAPKSTGGLSFGQARVSLGVAEDARPNERIASLQASSDLLHQQVDLVANKNENNNNNNSSQPIRSHNNGAKNATNKQQVVHYQILDDQTGHFGINSLGELLLKRPLDYEQKQVFKFRVLATQQRHSDICHVQVNVLNVNDNKPKVSLEQCSKLVLDPSFGLQKFDQNSSPL